VSDTLKTPPCDNRLCLLCVEDNGDIVDSELLLLAAFGFEARACYNNLSVLEVAEAEIYLPHVCLVDLNMLVTSVDELANRMRERDREVLPVFIAVTAMSEEASPQCVREARFNLHLIKPPDPALLVSVPRRLEHVARLTDCNSQINGSTCSNSQDIYGHD
jgi:two-component system OmpR family response regulator